MFISRSDSAESVDDPIVAYRDKPASGSRLESISKAAMAVFRFQPLGEIVA
jgi:hypothetical protein